jgi:hypothetical protein
MLPGTSTQFDTPMSRSSSRIGLVCVLLVAAFDLSTIRDGHDWGDDFSQYIRHASNLANGAPYARTSYLYNPENPSIGPRLYPPGFPVVLAPVVRAFGLELRPMKVEIVLFFVAALLLIHRLIQPFMPPVDAAAVVLMVGLNPFLWDFKDNVLSDIPFLFFFVAALVALTRADDRDGSPRRQIAYAILGGGTMYAAYATRVVGIVLLPSLLMRDLVRHRRVTIESAIAAATFVVLAGIQYALGPRDSSYTDLLTITPAIVAANVPAYLRWLADIFENGYADLPRKALFVSSAALAVVGYVSLWKQPRALLLAIAALFYLAVVIAWPLAQGTRFLIPVIPIYLACCLLGASSIDRVMAGRWGARHLALGVLIAVIGVTYAARYTTLPMTRVPGGIAKRESTELFDFVKTSTQPDDVIVFSRPRALALFTGRTVTPPPRAGDPCRLWSYMRSVRATYVVTGPGAANEEAVSLARFVGEYAANLHELMHNADVAVYRVDSAPAACVAHK